MRLISFSFILIAQFVFYSSAYGQVEAGKPKSSEFYLEALKNSKDSMYVLILQEFDDYLSQYSEDVDVRIEKCIVVEKAYYDSYEEYNPNYEEFEICLDELMRGFSDNLDVLMLKLNHTYGDSAIVLAKKIINLNLKYSDEWDQKKIAFVYEKIARQYSYGEERKKVIENAILAENLNDTLDLSLLMAEQYLAANNYEQAKYQLLRDLDSTDNAWDLRGKGNLLLELGMAEKALKAFNYLQRDTSAWIDNSTVAKALIENGMHSEAREYLIKDLNTSYSQISSLHQLFAYDYKYSDADSVLATYERLNSENFMNDAFGRYRVMMFFKMPFSGWRSTDLLKVLIFVLTVLVIVILPYLWILPIHYISDFYNLKTPSRSLVKANWGLKHLWILSSTLLFLQFLSILIFDYKGALALMSDSYFTEDAARISLDQANLAIFYFLAMLIMVLCFLKREDYYYLTAAKWSAMKSIVTGIGLAILLRATYFSMTKMGIMPEYNPSVIASLLDYFASINSYYHPFVTFIFIVVLVPFYEEYLFRAITLIAIEKHIKFIGANVLQAVFFALMHDNFSLFLFYFSFGLIAGYLVRRSGSLTSSITFHVTNNLFAFIALSKMF